MTSCRRRLFLRLLEDRTSPAVFTVTNTLDSGAGSLRTAITQLNLSSDPANVIDATGISGVITLASELPAVGKSVNILGPGDALVALDGGGTVRHLNFDAPGKQSLDANQGGVIAQTGGSAQFVLKSTNWAPRSPATR